MLKLHISPCPNDTFVFHAMLHSLVDTEGLEFEVHFEDIETLNRRAIEGDADIIKASVAVASQIDYTLLDSGAALGYGNGPIVVARGGNHAADPHHRVALPGEHTTATLLFRRYFSEMMLNVINMPFHAIAQAVAQGEVDWGVLIHEGRFTYAEVGLEKIADLGQLWEDNTKLPIPLGAIYASNQLTHDVIKKVERTISRSTLYAIQNREASASFVRSHARELAPDVLRNHIDYFVNDFTVSLSERGRQSIAKLLESTELAK